MIHYRGVFVSFLLILSFECRGEPLSLSSEEVAFFKALPLTEQPVLPLEDNFRFFNEKSTTYSLTYLEHLDRPSLERMGLAKGIAVAKMMVIILDALTTKVAFTHDSAHMEAYANTQLLAFLSSNKSARTSTAPSALDACTKKRTLCDQVVTLEELMAFITLQKNKILHHATKPSADHDNIFMPLLEGGRCFSLGSLSSNKITYRFLTHMVDSDFVHFSEGAWETLRLLILVKDALSSYENAQSIRKMSVADRITKANSEIYDHLQKIGAIDRAHNFDALLKACEAKKGQPGCEPLLSKAELIAFGVEIKKDIMAHIPKMPRDNNDEFAYKDAKQAEKIVRTWSCP